MPAAKKSLSTAGGILWNGSAELGNEGAMNQIVEGDNLEVLPLASAGEVLQILLDSFHCSVSCSTVGHKPIRDLGGIDLEPKICGTDRSSMLALEPLPFLHIAAANQFVLWYEPAIRSIGQKS